MPRALLAGVALVALTAPLGAAERFGAHLNFRRITPEQGLPAATVHAIHQDRRGFIWFGTGDGLVRYDGSELRLFRHEAGDPNGLPGDSVLDIAEDLAGDLWLATDVGLARWERGRERFTVFGAGPASGMGRPESAIDVLARPGAVWVVTGSGRLYRVDSATGAFTLLGAGDGSSSARPALTCLVQARQGTVWAGTTRGEVHRLDEAGATRQVVDVAAALGRRPADVNVTALAEDGAGDVWVGTDHGLLRIDVETGTVEPFVADPGDAGALPTPLVEALVVDRGGDLWVGTDGGGLSRFDATARRFVHYRHDALDPFSLTSDVVVALFSDRAGDLWVGTGPAGVSHANRLTSAFRTQRRQLAPQGTVTDDTVLSFAEDASGDLWVGTDTGLRRISARTGAWTTFRHDAHDPRSLAADAVTALHVDARGRLWVGTYRGGLNRLDGRDGPFTRYPVGPGRPDALADSRVWRIAEDTAHRLWIGTRDGGLSVFDPETGRVTHHRHDPSDPATLPDDNVLCVMVSRAGVVWAGTRRGLARWHPDKGAWERITGAPDGAASPAVMVVDLLEAGDGTVWIATQGGGLQHYDPATGRLDAVRRAGGLPSDQVRGVLEAGDGALWVSTNQGLARLDPVSRRVRVYDAADGVQGLLFNRGSRLRRRSGELLFGGAQGFTAFDPAEVAENTDPPPVVLTQFEVFARPVTPSDRDSSLERSITETARLVVPMRLSVLSFQFAALSFRAPHKNRFAYVLEGFDRTWRPAGVERRATYTNLGPGRYVFRVRAANSDGTWNDEGAALEVIVVPPFWRTTWFLFSSAGLVLAVLVGGAWWVSSYRMRRRLEVAEHARSLAVERQRAEETLRLRERNYLEIFNSTEDAIILRDVATGIMLDANDAAVRMFGYPKAELLRKTIGELSEGGEGFDQQQGVEHLQEALARGAVKFEWRSRRASGEAFWSEVQLTRSSIGGENRVLGVVRDISERRRLEDERLRLERQLQHAQKLESLGVLAGGIAHDFNNLLVGILGNLDLALRDLPADAVSRRGVAEAQQAAQRAADLSRQMLAYSGRGRFVVERIALHELVGEMVHLIGTSIGKRASLRLALDETAPPIEGDATQVRQVVMNLAINASEAIGEGGGTITVSTGAAHYAAEDLAACQFCDEPVGGRYAWLEVTDTGAGMDEATLQRIFDPFFTTKFAGRGLGLSAVSGIVRSHRGALIVRSRPGAGTTFRVLFPAVAQSAERVAPRAPAAEAPWRFTGTALLVDDEEGVRSVGSRMLQRLGFDVVTATDGHQAVAACRERKEPFTVVLLDLTMPGLSGEDTLAALLDIDPTLRVLISSGFAEHDVAARFRGQAIAGFVAKPYSLADLSGRLRAALGPGPGAEPVW